MAAQSNDPPTSPAAGPPVTEPCWFWATRRDLAVCCVLLTTILTVTIVRREIRGRDPNRAVLLRPEEIRQALDVNAATAAELQELAGVGPALANAIVAHRCAHGPFRERADLSTVPGMRPGTLETIWNDICAGGRTATGRSASGSSRASSNLPPP